MIALLVVGAVVGVIVAAAQGSTYRAEAQIVAGPPSDFFGANAGTVQPFTQTMRSLLQSDAVASRAAQAVGGGISPRTVQDHLSISNPPESSALTLRYDDSSQARAVAVLGAVVTAFNKLVSTRLGGGHKAAPAARVVVFDDPHAVGSVGPSWLRDVGFGAVAGFLLGLALAYVREGRREEARLRQAEPAESRPRTDGALAGAPARAKSPQRASRGARGR